MASDHPPADRAPPTTTTEPLAADHDAPVDNANPNRDRLDRVLDRRTAFAQAQGMLSQLAGCSPSRASQVLLQVGAQLGFESAEGVAEFFLTSASADPAGSDTLAFTRRAATVARDYGIAINDFATLIAGGRGVVVRGELDIATAPLLAAAFANHHAAAAAPGLMVLDLHDMTFVDITGVRALSNLHTRASELGDHLRVDPPLDAFTLWTLKFAIESRWLPSLFADGAPWLR